MGKLWQRQAGQDGKIKLVELKQGALTITSPTVVFLTGFSTINSTGGYIAGAIKRLEDMLSEGHDLKDKVKLVGWSHSGIRNLFNMAAYNCFPGLFQSRNAKKLAREVFLPLVAKDGASVDKKGIVTGERHSLEDVKEKLKNLTFFAYSAGTVLAQETYNATSTMMHKLGYSKEETKELLHDVALISVGNMSRPTKEGNRFSTLYMAATNDRLIKYKTKFWPSLKEMFWRRVNKLTIHKVSETSLYLTTPVQADLYEMKKQKDGSEQLKPIDKLYPKWFPIASKHELPHYITGAEHNNDFAKIARYSLLNAIKRESRPDLYKMLEPTSGLFDTSEKATTPSENDTKYQGLIKEALNRKKPDNKPTTL